MSFRKVKCFGITENNIKPLQLLEDMVSVQEIKNPITAELWGFLSLFWGVLINRSRTCRVLDPKQTINTVFSLLEKTHTLTMLEEFNYYSPFQMLITAMLSSRTKDSITMPLVKKLFAEHLHPGDFIKMNINELEERLYGIGFYKVKARNVKASSKAILEKYNGAVPDIFEELISLPGVGRKTANCVLAYAFKKPAIAADIHVHRISNRLGWTKTTHPEKTEEALKKLIPKNLWIDVNRLLVGHGQNICVPINPKCNLCYIKKYCNYWKKEKDV